MAIVHARHAEESVLLMRRTERETDSWSGHWSLPGGRRDPSDASLLETALRELWEECGVRVNADGHTALNEALARRKAGRFLTVAPFVFPVPEARETVLHPDEAVESRWLPLGVLRDPAEHRLLAIPGMPPGRLYPAIPLGAMPLWGFTYRLLTEWLQLLPADRIGAGQQAADEVLAMLAELGAPVTGEWRDRVATVRGPIPAAELADRLSARSNAIPLVNTIDIRTDAVRLLGLMQEEYVIQAEAPGAADDSP